MADKTKINWTDATWNIITGCSVCSAGCTNCYAMRLAGSRLQHHWSRVGLTKMTKAGSVWTGETRFNDEWLSQPMRWKRPRKIFVCAHGDLFHESVPDEWIDQVFAIMSFCPQHTFQILTKRPERMRRYFTEFSGRWSRIEIAARKIRNVPVGKTLEGYRLTNFPHVWLGVSVENQKAANERIPHLLETPAAVRFISGEPLLGKLDLTRIPRQIDGETILFDALRGFWHHPNLGYVYDRLHWVIAGGETGPGARPSYPDWFRSLRDQCVAAGVPFNLKHKGEWRDAYETGEAFEPYSMERVGKKRAGRLLDGVEYNAIPEVQP